MVSLNSFPAEFVGRESLCFPPEGSKYGESYPNLLPPTHSSESPTQMSISLYLRQDMMVQALNTNLHAIKTFSGSKTTPAALFVS